MIKVTLEFPTIYAAAAALMTLREAGHDASIPDTDKVTPVATTGKQKPASAAASTGTRAGAQAASAGSVQTGGEAGNVDAGAQKDASSAPTASTEKPSASPAQADTTAAPLDYEKDVKPVVIKVGAAGKRDALVELLKKFGVAKGPEVAADKLPAFKSELEALLA